MQRILAVTAVALLLLGCATAEEKSQISDPLYYDWTNGANWMSSIGRDAGADAVINFDTRVIPAKCKNVLWLLACPREDRSKYFEAWGTAVVFES